MRTKFIFVTGGVLSSLGKGLASASIGCLLVSPTASLFVALSGFSALLCPASPLVGS